MVAFRGPVRIRTGVAAFAELCLAARPQDPFQEGKDKKLYRKLKLPFLSGFRIILYFFYICYSSAMNTETLAVHDVYKYMNDRHIIMSFLGDFTHTVVTSLLSSVKKIIDTTEMDFQLKKRFYAVVVECLDNISRHNYALEGEKLPTRHSGTIFTISEYPEHFTIQTGNYIQNKDVVGLNAKLEKVNSLDKEGLKELYRQKILDSPSGGGGLGIIDMSIRTGCKISYDFKPVTNDISFFVLQTILSK